ncbi:amidohydrolase family protein [Flammeovirgaceae bacterium SG7u.111]|nr:amidohydrolase family protein [Flammeovirgaceae bacterium SG7u.132]WPO34493.1 amidohydrolase family protein [Flammeovirgaceae bacterium SG7u.111]
MKKNYNNLLTLLALLLLSSQFSFAQQTYIHCGKLIDGVGDKAQKKMTIVVEGEKIISVQKGFKKPGDDDKLIDLSSQTVMPGFMDMHVHLEQETSPTRYMDRFRKNEADIAFESTVYAKRTLMAGFTTVRDLGGSGVNISMRKAVDAGYIVGPRIFTSGKSIATTGGHADPTNGMKKSLMGDPGPAEGVVNSPEDARKAVRQRYKNGADVIKITATGGVLSVAKDGQSPQFNMEELKAIVETAKDYNMITAAHAHGAEGMKRAVLAGITSIEHGTKMTEEVMDLMIERGTYLVPTITAGKSVAEKAKIPNYYPAVVVPKALEIGPQIQGTFAKAYERGVKIVFGTDAGVFPHGENWKEFGYMVEAGMPAMEAIKSATMEAAKLLRMEDELGSIQPGRFADIVATPENPLEEISTMGEVMFVMKGGKVYKYTE